MDSAIVSRILLATFRPDRCCTENMQFFVYMGRLEQEYPILRDGHFICLPINTR